MLLLLLKCLLLRPIVVLMLGTTIDCGWCVTFSQDVAWLFYFFKCMVFRTNMYVACVVSLKPRCHKADVIGHGVENQYVSEGCCVTKKPGFYLAYYLSLRLWWIHQYLIPLCVAVGICYIPIKGWVIDCDDNGFFDGSCQIMIFFDQNAKIVNRYIMTSGVMMVMDGWRGFHVLFKSFHKCSAWLINIYFLLVLSVTPISVYHPTFLSDGIPILGFYLEVLESSASP